MDWRELKLVYRRYASLLFLVAVDQDDNELITLEMIHLFVEVLDKHFGNVCELDLVFNFYKAYWLLDEVFMAGMYTHNFPRSMMYKPLIPYWLHGHVGKDTRVTAVMVAIE